MSKFKKKTNKQPAISTASLPDIVFVLLFFFMVTTVMREVDLLVEVTTPNATEITKLKNAYFGISFNHFNAYNSAKDRVGSARQILENPLLY